MEDRLEVLILRILKAEQATSKSAGMTLKEFPLKDLGITLSTLYKRMIILEKKGFVQKGYKDSQAYTYYITEKGLEILDLKSSDES